MILSLVFHLFPDVSPSDIVKHIGNKSSRDLILHTPDQLLLMRTIYFKNHRDVFNLNLTLSQCVHYLVLRLLLCVQFQLLNVFRCSLRPLLLYEVVGEEQKPVFSY
jgi:hypothetical protein